jgi:hypothetical protein
MGIGRLFGAAIATRLVRLFGSARAMLICKMLGTFIGVRPALWIISGILAAASIILFFSPIRYVHDLPAPSEDYVTT